MADDRLFIAVLDDHGHMHRIEPWDGTWRDLASRLLQDEGSRLCLIQHRAQPAATTPAPRDIALTRAVLRALRPLDIDLIDHVIWNAQTPFSFRRAGLL